MVVVKMVPSRSGPSFLELEQNLWNDGSLAPWTRFARREAAEFGQDVVTVGAPQCGGKAAQGHADDLVVVQTA